MNLDDLDHFRELDPDDMLGQIDGLPDQLEQAWDLGHRHPLPDWPGIRQVVVAGMGGSAIGADLVAAYLAPYASVPVITLREYNLPAWARSSDTLVVASSHSGNTEETLSAFKQAAEAGCRLAAITRGGKLAELAESAGGMHWGFEHEGQPRAAIGFSFSLLLALLTRLGLNPDPEAELRDALAEMRVQQETIRAEVPVVQNSAKRMGGQFMGRWGTIFGAGVMAPVARRWKTQLNEIPKAWAQYEVLPEADHNTLNGSMFPEEIFGRSMLIFLVGRSQSQRSRLRAELTRKSLMLEGLNTDTIKAPGKTALANMWTGLHYGDYAAFYLAMAYGVDPTPIAAIEAFKEDMSTASG
ncbi:MAG: bifunctional phosphoglucose/phosphomannose isomerase [Anaerolineales bacterium]|nr:bifunctional phosphoglucose/phosphomannose isomerase [Anaerolineales bacterium]